MGTKMADMSRWQRVKDEIVGGKGAIQPCAEPHVCVPEDRKPKGHQRFIESRTLRGDPLQHFRKRKRCQASIPSYANATGGHLTCGSAYEMKP